MYMNIGKTNLNLLKKAGEDPCDVCLKGTKNNAIVYGGCAVDIQEMQWYKGYRCCLGNARPVDGRPKKELMAGHKLEVALDSGFLDGMLSDEWLSAGCDHTLQMYTFHQLHSSS